MRTSPTYRRRVRGRIASRPKRGLHRAIGLALVLALGIGVSGCSIFSDSARPVAEKAKFPVPPGGLAKNSGAPGASWGVFQPVAVTWSDVAPMSAVMPATYSAADTKTVSAPRSGLVPPAAEVVARTVPPAGTWQQNYVVQTEAAVASAPPAPAPAPVLPVATRALTPPAATQPTFTALSASTMAVAAAPQPWAAASAGRAPTPVSRVAAPAAQPAAWPAPSIQPMPVTATPRSILPQGQQPVVDYAMLSALTGRPVGYPAPAPYVARQVAYVPPQAYPVQQVGPVTVDYSALQN